jgi:hypothetical protein
MSARNELMSHCLVRHELHRTGVELANKGRQIGGMGRRRIVLPSSGQGAVP